MNVTELASQIAKIDGVLPNRGATATDISATETRLQSTIPSELRQLVAVMNGCEGETPSEGSWTSFWPLGRWTAVGDSGSTDLYPHAILFADHCQESWCYAFESTGADTIRILKINGPDAVVSESLAEFLAAVISDDPKLYRAEPIERTQR